MIGQVDGLVDAAVPEAVRVTGRVRDELHAGEALHHPLLEELPLAGVDGGIALAPPAREGAHLRAVGGPCVAHDGIRHLVALEHGVQFHVQRCARERRREGINHPHPRVAHPLRRVRQGVPVGPVGRGVGQLHLKTVAGRVGDVDERDRGVAVIAGAELLN